jgi:hypothetical protein
MIHNLIKFLKFFCFLSAFLIALAIADRVFPTPEPIFHNEQYAEGRP